MTHVCWKWYYYSSFVVVLTKNITIEYIDLILTMHRQILSSFRSNSVNEFSLPSVSKYNISG